MGTVPTTRETGKHAQVWLGGSSGGSDVYAGADLRSASYTVNGQTADLSANDDDWNVEVIVRGSVEVQVEKVYNATPAFLEAIWDAIEDQEAINLVFRYQSGAVLQGLFNIVTVSGSAPDADAAIESATFRSTGAVTRSGGS